MSNLITESQPLKGNSTFIKLINNQRKVQAEPIDTTGMTFAEIFKLVKEKGNYLESTMASLLGKETTSGTSNMLRGRNGMSEIETERFLANICKPKGIDIDLTAPALYLLSNERRFLEKATPEGKRLIKKLLIMKWGIAHLSSSIKISEQTLKSVIRGTYPHPYGIQRKLNDFMARYSPNEPLLYPKAEEQLKLLEAKRAPKKAKIAQLEERVKQAEAERDQARKERDQAQIDFEQRLAQLEKRMNARDQWLS